MITIKMTMTLMMMTAMISITKSQLSSGNLFEWLMESSLAFSLKARVSNSLCHSLPTWFLMIMMMTVMMMRNRRETRK